MIDKVIDLVKKHKRMTIAITAGVILVIVLLFVFMRPERSVASFCRVANEEKAVITGDHSYEERLKTYGRLESVAPDAIQADVTAIRKGQQSIVDNPANAITTELGLTSAGDRVVKYISSNCSADFWNR